MMHLKHLVDTGRVQSFHPAAFTAPPTISSRRVPNMRATRHRPSPFYQQTYYDHGALCDQDTHHHLRLPSCAASVNRASALNVASQRHNKSLPSRFLPPSSTPYPGKGPTGDLEGITLQFPRLRNQMPGDECRADQQKSAALN